MRVDCTESSHVLVHQLGSGQQRYTHICSNIGSRVLLHQSQDLKRKTDEEIRVHMEIENFLRQYYKVRLAFYVNT